MRPAAPFALSLVLATGALGPGCHNACQDLCKEMYDYALECDLPVTQDELKACYKEQSSPNTPRSERQLCRQNFDNLRDEWTCEDLSAYWDGEGGEQPEDTAGTDATDSLPLD